MAEAAYLVTDTVFNFQPWVSAQKLPTGVGKGQGLGVLGRELTSDFVRFKSCHSSLGGEVLLLLRIGEWKPMVSIGVGGVLTWALERRLNAP